MFGMRTSISAVLVLGCCLAAAPNAHADDDCDLFNDALSKAQPYNDQIEEIDGQVEAGQLTSAQGFRDKSNAYLLQSQPWSAIADQVQDISIRFVVVSFARNAKRRSDVEAQAARDQESYGGVQQGTKAALDQAISDFEGLKTKFELISDRCQ